MLATDGSCDAEDGESTSATDCNDASADQFPGNNEVVDDGIDQDCNGADTINCFVDADHDGFGTSDAIRTVPPAADGSCDAAQGEADTATDCDDSQCLAQIGGALGVDELITGSLAMLGSTLKGGRSTLRG